MRGRSFSFGVRVCAWQQAHKADGPWMNATAPMTVPKDENRSHEVELNICTRCVIHIIHTRSLSPPPRMTRAPRRGYAKPSPPPDRPSLSRSLCLRYVRLWITANWGNQSITQLSEVQFVGAPIKGRYGGEAEHNTRPAPQWMT